MKGQLLCFSGLFLSLFFGINVFSQKIDYASYVDPFIGTGGHGHVFLGANVPFGAVQVGPDNYYKGWDWCSGYNYSDSILTGFSHLHLSGTGAADLGDIQIMPYTGQMKSSPGTNDEPLSGYAAVYSHKDEVAKPGFYSVNLKKYDEKVELTASERVAFHRYTFILAQDAHIAINLERGIGENIPVKTFFKKIDDFTYTGYRYSTGWAKDKRVYFAIKVSRTIDSLTLYNDNNILTGTEAEGDKITAILNFSTHVNEVIMLKVGISPVSQENALANIKAEIPDWDFERVEADAYENWNRELGKVEVTTYYINDMRTFYTSLYHAYIAPVLYNDCNGDYLGTDKKIYHNPGFQNYSTFSLWDTYRAEQPLLTILQPQRVPDMINSLLAIYQQQGKLPIWPLMGCETNCMVGYSAVPIIADAYLKGFQGFDPQLALDAMVASSTRNDNGMQLMKNKGYIPADRENESVSKSLEYSISDWCIYQVAVKLGRIDDVEYYSKRAKAFTQYFDTSTGFMRARLDDGTFRVPFDPVKATVDYTEGNSWQYTWMVPQDVEGLIHLFGGDRPFVQKLDSLFVATGDLGKDAPEDISGLIGQFAQGNEPSHHIPYLYAYAGQQWKTAEKVHSIIHTLYHDRPDGLCGNEDCGQMSAWYVLSAMGFYPVNPAASCFVFGTPLFNEVKINLPNKKKFTLTVLNPNPNSIYINTIIFNNLPYKNSYITYKDIMKGGSLQIIMSDKPNKNFGAGLKNRPVSKVYNWNWPKDYKFQFIYP